MSIRKFVAFTLAEVLITLGIIGIVASMTIPALLANTQKQQYVTGLKKAYSNITEAFKLILIDEGVYDLSQTNLFNGGAFSNSVRQTNIDEIVKKHFKTSKTCKVDDTSCKSINYKALDSKNITSTSKSPMGDSYDFYTIDNMYVQLALFDTCEAGLYDISKIKSVCGFVLLDVNGQKTPNQQGRDFFVFILAQDGNLYPYAGQENAKFACGSSFISSPTSCFDYWKSLANWCSNSSANHINNSDRLGCAAQIMEENWEMNY